jgi:YjbE family integral membrane protein
MLQQLFDFGAIVLADLVLSGDNALIIGMAAASLSPELRKRAILFGIIVAAGLRIIFALVATRLLGVPGLLFLGSLLLFWVCWRLYGEIRDNIDREAAKALETAEHLDEGYTGPARKSLGQALLSITVADLSMSIDNVLAVAAIADGNTEMLVFGLGLACLQARLSASRKHWTPLTRAWLKAVSPGPTTGPASTLQQPCSARRQPVAVSAWTTWPSYPGSSSVAARSFTTSCGRKWAST